VLTPWPLAAAAYRRQGCLHLTGCCCPSSSLAALQLAQLLLQPAACMMSACVSHRSAQLNTACIYHYPSAGCRCHMRSTQTYTVHKRRTRQLRASYRTCSVARSRAVAALCLSAAASFPSASRRALSAVARLPSRRPLSAAACCASLSCCVSESTCARAGKGMQAHCSVTHDGGMAVAKLHNVNGMRDPQQLYWYVCRTVPQ
jgi:hypothetical protein